jgi:hypothetical protein
MPNDRLPPSFIVQVPGPVEPEPVTLLEAIEAWFETIKYTAVGARWDGNLLNGDQNRLSAEITRVIQPYVPGWSGVVYLTSAYAGALDLQLVDDKGKPQGWTPELGATKKVQR